jgi:hypothetical protein
MKWFMGHMNGVNINKFLVHHSVEMDDAEMIEQLVSCIKPSHLKFYNAFYNATVKNHSFISMKLPLR